MKHLSGLLHKLTAVAAVAVALTSCNRAEYAMLPKTSSAYHGTQRGVIVTPAPAAASVAPEATAPVAAEAEAPAALAQTTPAAAEKPVAAAAAPAKATARAAAPAKAAAPKLNFAQKAVVAKLVKKADKLAAKAQINKKSEVASQEDANAISRNIKLGIILLLVGILVGLIIPILGSVIAIIGIVFIVLGLLDEV